MLRVNLARGHRVTAFLKIEGRAAVIGLSQDSGRGAALIPFRLYFLQCTNGLGSPHGSFTPAYTCRCAAQCCEAFKAEVSL